MKRKYIQFSDSCLNEIWFEIDEQDGFYIHMHEGTDKHGEYGIGRELTLKQAKELIEMLKEFFEEKC